MSRPRDPPSWFGQPPGLTVLFLTEMWEKFSFYGMRAMLVYYMTRQLGMAQAHASLVYGLYTGFVYFTPIVGGYAADRWLGRRRSVVLGGSIMALGHFMMAFEPLFYPALAAIALGNGLFLPSLPSQIGSLYGEDDPRRGRAYNVYYVGVNLGAFLAPLACGTLGEMFGWHYGFAAAGVGMLIGLCIYVAGARHLPLDPACAPPQPVPQRGAPRLFLLLAAVALAVVVFRGAYEQLGNTIALWAEQGVDRGVWGHRAIPMTWFQALNPLLVFLLTPLILRRWRTLSGRGREPSSIAKMAIGAATVAGAYLMLAGVCFAAGPAQAGWLWLFAFFALLTAGELYILPVGLGVFARLAPAGFAATAVAAWFLAAFAGNLLAGAIGGLWSRVPPAVFFAMVGGVAALAAVLLLLLQAFGGRRLDEMEAQP